MGLNLNFKTEFAKTSRAHCKHCAFPDPAPIPQGLAKLVIEDWTGRDIQPIYATYCSNCGKKALTELVKAAYRAKRRLEKLEKLVGQ